MKPLPTSQTSNTDSFLQPSFMHLAFSVAFSLFIFAEYIRYFALYPFGASLHIFLSEFLDEKDKGSAILSHFYLLIGCAGVLWLERCVKFARSLRADLAKTIY